VIPILTISDSTIAVSIAEALSDGGVPALEVTLRTDAGLRAIEAIAAQCPNILLIAGTLVKPEDFAAAKSAGAVLSVSPGFHESLHEAASDAGLPWMPGVATASDLIGALRCNRTVVKFFPAASLGGIEALKALSAPFPQVTFCPTGGIGCEDMATYLAHKEVIAVGGSWLTPKAALDSKNWDVNWDVIRENARQARALVRQARGEKLVS
jgi:2-dehydro-3-deoxyphosphogluconate aldolase/(4S)-4-hydroxy-2-oxoglutarate aldolase